MTERRKDILLLTALLAVLVIMLSPVLFTTKIIRAPDVINEYFWTVKDIGKMPFLDIFKINISSAGWSPYLNSGYTTEGGGASMGFLIYHRLIYWLFPSPANVAWFIMFHLFFGGAGTYLFCRAIGASRMAAFVGGIIFACSTENVSLINAGHVLKLATISYAPLAFYFIEKGFQTRRLLFFLSAAFTLAFQFFNYHWQIAFYTCLCMGCYGLLRFAGEIWAARSTGNARPAMKLLGLNMALLVFFLTTVSISLLPLQNWSKETNRGVASGANQGKGGLDREEAMSWSMPPEEIATFVVPGFFGLSRQEAGPNPKNIASYYWGRMNFTQTNDYMGLLPWLLLPLVLIFRRDRYTWLAVVAIAGTLLFSTGKYSAFYNLLYDHFPGINKFRVPKMMLFMTSLTLGVITARGLDILLDENIRKTKAFRSYAVGICLVPLSLILLLLVLRLNQNGWINMFIEALSQPTRYEQGMYLIEQRWQNILTETAIAAGWAAAYVTAFMALFRGWIPAKSAMVTLTFLLLFDLGRVNAKFMFLTDVPTKSASSITPTMDYLLRDSNQYRTFPLNADPQQYAAALIPTVFMSTPVQQLRWQEFLDNFSFNSPMTDLLNIKYLVLDSSQYQQDKNQLSPKYQQVFQSPDNSEVVVRNNAALPKAWLVQSAILVPDSRQRLAILGNPAFNPAQLAIIETQPALPLKPPGTSMLPASGRVTVEKYENEFIRVNAASEQNSLLVLGEKYYKGWQATVDGKNSEIVPVDHILRGVYLTPGRHNIEFRFDPLPFKIGKYLTLSSFAFFAAILIREWVLHRKRVPH